MKLIDLFAVWQKSKLGDDYCLIYLSSDGSFLIVPEKTIPILVALFSLVLQPIIGADLHSMAKELIRERIRRRIPELKKKLVYMKSDEMLKLQDSYLITRDLVLSITIKSDFSKTMPLKIKTEKHNYDYSFDNKVLNSSGYEEIKKLLESLYSGSLNLI